MPLITAENLKELRRKHGMTGEQLGAYLGVAKATISKMESGKREISPSEQRLLRLRFYGLLPENVCVGGSIIDFNDDELKRIQVMANREGYQTIDKFIASKIRIYLAMREAEQSEKQAKPNRPRDLRETAKPRPALAQKGRALPEANQSAQEKDSEDHIAAGE